jgi:uncharacterized surface protein with fasciclin (FAS1) repeats
MIRVSTVAVLATLTLSACNPAPEAEADGPAAPSSRTLAAELKAAGDLGTLEAVVANSGLEQVLEGVGPYTVFAPADGAFGSAEVFDFRDEAEKAQAAALLRAHMIPGAVTRADVEAALSRAENGTVEMRTLDGGLVTFYRDGDAVVVATPDGARGRLTGSETLASNGVIHPVDAVLLKAPTA